MPATTPRRAPSSRLALDLPGCELPALAAMLPLLRAGAYLPRAGGGAAQRLAARLGDAAFEVPDGLLRQIASTGIPGDDDLLLASLERRLAHFPAAEDKPSRPGLVELLDVTAELQERRGKQEAASETLGRLLALAPNEGCSGAPSPST